MIKMQRILSAIMSLIMILSLSAGMDVLSFAEGIVDSGSCGPNAKWTFSDDGVLTVSGNGEMTSAPYHEKYSEKITSVVIEEGITVICSEAFLGCENLQNVQLPHGLEEIKDNAFLQCISLFSIEFPETLKKIGTSAFWNSGLRMIKIPDSVETIENDAFGCCMFEGAYLGKKISVISSQMLRENGSLTAVYIGKNVKTIQANAFYLSDNLENIYYEGTEAEWNKIKVETNNFPLENANIKFNCTDSSYSIWQEPRWSENSLIYYSIKAGNVSIDGINWNVSGDFVIPEFIDDCLVTHIKDTGFTFLPDLKSVTIPKGVKEIEGLFASQCFNLENIYVDEENEYYSSVDGNLFNKDKTELLRYAIGNYRQEYLIPDSVTTINEFAFCRLYRELKINIPQSVTNIENSAFYNAHRLYYITVDKNNPNYSSDDGVLFNKDKTELICFPGIRAGAYHYVDLKNNDINTDIDCYTIPDGVTKIAEGAFSSCVELRFVSIPDSVTTIGENAFEYCKLLESVQLPVNLTSIENYTFRESGLTAITIPDSVTSIGVQAFLDCPNLAEINLPDGVSYIGAGAFDDTAYYFDENNWENNALYIGNNLIEVSDDSITEYTVKDGTKNIACAAFSWCSNLKQLNLPDSLCSISDYAFAGMSNVEKIDIPSGVTEISDYAFMQCSKLSEISIPKSVTKIGKGIFYWSDNIRQINYAGDKASWDNIEISDEENEWVSYLTINYEKEPTADKTVTGKIEVKSDAVKVDESNKILTIADKTTSEALAKVIDNDNFVIVGKDGKELGKSDLVGTGSKIQIKDNSDKVVSEYTVLVPNDVDGNGKITAADARLALRAAASLENLEGVYAQAANVDGKDKITAADARKILRKAAGLE